MRHWARSEGRSDGRTDAHCWKISTATASHRRVEYSLRTYLQYETVSSVYALIITSDFL